MYAKTVYIITKSGIEVEIFIISPFKAIKADNLTSLSISRTHTHNQTNGMVPTN